ncbi:MAG: DUF3842 family protein [Clostridia bacterium]|nr:DUF3842 family protein [Oscillospiraceae bacterium]MBQ2912032.1 DUF3842 family protein [Clostridia bacterium]MBQ6868634.1 DUF3842 family protein [Clostridia bacterium]MBQ6934109.1 DUF3842 family protein [Clostridia bacterium]
MKILIIDGQGGRLGKLLIEKIKSDKPSLELIAVGTNSIATSVMLKAGADMGATGENPVVVNAKNADVIIGPVGIIVANALMGEVTPKMACAVGESEAFKLLIPVNKCNNYIVGTKNIGISDLVNEAAGKLYDIIG